MPGPAPRRATPLALVPSLDPKAPAPPPDLRPALLGAWREFWASPLAAQVITTDLPALRRLFGLYERRERFDEEGMDEAVVSGSTGQMTLHPLLKEVDALDAKILALEDRFGMSPMARLKLQVTLGDADRSLDEINARVAARAAEREGRQDPRTVARRVPAAPVRKPATAD